MDPESPAPAPAPEHAPAPATTVAAPPVTLRSVLHEFAGYLKNPRLIDPVQRRGPGQLQRWLWLTALLVTGLLAVLLPLLGTWQKAFGIPDPVAFKGVPKTMLIPLVVAVAPVLEELLFRGWQSGTRGALWLFGCALIALAALLGAARLHPLAGAGVIAAAAVLALAGWLVMRRRPGVPRWFVRIFPAVFYLVAIGFALFHLTNYQRADWLVLPMVLPQLWAGLVLGFVRQRVGLLAGMASHALSNSIALGLALLSGG